MHNCYKNDALAAGWRRRMSLARGKSVILNMAKEILNVMEVLPRRPRWFGTIHSVKLDVSERLPACPTDY